MEHKRKIKLSETGDVREFVASASKCDFDIDVFYNRITVDAKSLLGVFSLDLSKRLTVVYSGVNSDFERTLQKFCAA